VKSKEKKTESDKKIDIASKEFPKIVRDLFPELRRKNKYIIRAKPEDESTGESEFDVEERTEPENPSEIEGETKEWENKRKAKKTHRKPRPHAYIIIDGIKYYFKVTPVDYLDESYPRYASSINEDESLLEIIINLNNPYVNHSKEENTDMLLINIGEWIIESILQHTIKIKETQKFFEERDDKISQVDWNEWLNRIDLIYAEEKLKQQTKEHLPEDESENNETHEITAL